MLGVTVVRRGYVFGCLALKVVMADVNLIVVDHLKIYHCDWAENLLEEMLRVQTEMQLCWRARAKSPFSHFKIARRRFTINIPVSRRWAENLVLC